MIEEYDEHRMLYLGHLKCEIPKEKKFYSVDVAVIESEKKFGIISGDVTLMTFCVSAKPREL